MKDDGANMQRLVVFVVADDKQRVTRIRDDDDEEWNIQETALILTIDNYNVEKIDFWTRSVEVEVSEKNRICNNNKVMAN